MERNDDDRYADELIDLGGVMDVTKGGMSVIFDNHNGRDLTGPGIADD